MRTYTYYFAEITLLLTCCLTSAAQATAQTVVQLSAAEKQLLDATNQERANAKLPPLRPSAALCQAARGHSANMAKQQKMDHVLDGKDPFRRIHDTGYSFLTAGENIAYGFDSTEEVMRVWMNSPGHRRNILNPAYTEIGLARVNDAQGVPYYTQVFGTPAP